MLYAGRGRTAGHPRADVGGLLGTDALLVMEIMTGPKDFVERSEWVQGFSRTRGICLKWIKER